MTAKSAFGENNIGPFSQRWNYLEAFALIFIFQPAFCSDIDIVILGEWKYLPLYTLEEELIKHRVALASSTRVIDRAAVPIVKFQHFDTRINVDVSFNKTNGIRGVQVVKEYIQRFPTIPKLIYILKHFLFIRDLNEVFSGGLGSYSLFMLCVNFLQLHPRYDARLPSVNLGVLLIEFFELYGRCFNYSSAGIRIRGGGSYFNKHKYYEEMNIHSSSILCIEDPIMIGNDLCKGSYAMTQIQLAFDYAYRSLTTIMCKETYKSTKSTVCSYLGKIINVNPVEVRRREETRERWLNLGKAGSVGANKPENRNQYEIGKRKNMNSSGDSFSVTNSKNNSAKKIKRNVR